MRVEEEKGRGYKCEQGLGFIYNVAFLIEWLSSAGWLK
jgi:hypothetical protein